MTESINRYLERIKDREDNEHEFNDQAHVRVLVSAFTGKAAHNIKGMTMHAAFHLPVPFSVNMPPLSAASLKRIRKQLYFLRFIIIDEISLVSSIMFEGIDKRLREIFDNDLIFGGIPVLAVGDLNQLQPVMANWVFQTPSRFDFKVDQYTRLNGTVNLLWSNFKLFELKTIMRQDNREFSTALTSFAEYGPEGLNEQHRELFNKCIVDESCIPSDTVFLFTTNKDRINHNKNVIRKKPGQLIIHKAQHEIKGPITDEFRDKLEKCLSKYEKESLPLEIMLKETCRYSLTCNLNVPDGLVHGASGILMKISKNERDEAEILWLDFGDHENTGVEQRLRFKERNRNRLISAHINTNAWTPIVKQSCTLREKNCKWTAIRHQFPVEEGEGLTICKSQGLTLSKVAINLTQVNLTQAALYVAMSRVRNMTDLMFYGRSTFTEKKYNLNKAKKLRSEKPVAIELERMRRESCFMNKFEFLYGGPIRNDLSMSYDLNTTNSWVILFHNVEGLHMHLEQIISDKAVKVADALLLTECHTDVTKAKNTNIPGFNQLGLTGANRAGMKNGSVVYVKETTGHKNTFRYLGNNAFNNVYDSKKETEITLMSMFYKREHIYICMVYKHPDVSVAQFWKTIKEFIRETFKLDKSAKLSQKIFIFGDFNIDFKSQDGQFMMGKMKSKLGI